MNETDFFNMYVERIINEVTELTKLKMINDNKDIIFRKIYVRSVKKN